MTKQIFDKMDPQKLNVLICIMNGGAIFFTHLMRCLNVHNSVSGKSNFLFYKNLRN